jgi:hypothetical protein
LIDENLSIASGLARKLMNVGTKVRIISGVYAGNVGRIIIGGNTIAKAIRLESGQIARNVPLGNLRKV